MISRTFAWAVTAALTAIAAVSYAADQHYGGYLTPGEFDVTSVIEPAPRPGDPR
jgi:acid phosphatase (class A)